MGVSGYGFGHGRFGNFPFGHGDFGRGTVIKSFPNSYLYDEDGNENALLMHYLEIVSEKVNQTKKEIDSLPDQIDPNEVREDILRVLAKNVAVTVDDYEPVEFRRSLVNNAVLFYRVKGTDDTYRIRGKISGYDVDVSNIWRINPEAELVFGGLVSIGIGNGLASQILEGNAGTNPINKSSLLVEVDGLVIGVDNGLGGITSSNPMLVSGTINYETGAYLITVSSVSVGSQIGIRFESNINGELIGNGNGVVTSFVKEPIQFYPSLKQSMKVYVDGSLCGEETSPGVITGIGLSPCTGIIDDSRGKVTVEFSSPPIDGAKITISYDKSLLAEFLNRYPDDVYQIPLDSGYWYVTKAPGLPGMPSVSQCGYCQTSFVKIKFTLVRSSGVTGSSENFFDRLVRKVREVVPIHIRDLLYEIVISVEADEHQYLTATHGNELQLPGLQYDEESTWLVCSVFPHFDAIAADGVRTDNAGYVRGTVEQV